mmetsp:Transcript_36447/g.48848  ORF Transcript_36447/g.48848 Transcript_36447/m.48848 type:complete len:326 (-) Transcript_36447:1525-2502(-)
MDHGMRMQNRQLPLVVAAGGLLASLYLLTLASHPEVIDQQTSMSLSNITTKNQDAPKQLSMLTWNVWFGNLRYRERYNAILKEVLSRDVDVACFQEVTEAFMETLFSCNDVVSNYDMSPNKIRDYGAMILAKKKLNANFEEIKLPTRMDRSLILARMENIVIGTVHLESLNSEDCRRRQLAAANEAMTGDETAILCGDFNFDSTQTWGDWRRSRAARSPENLENNVLKKELPCWADAWPTLKGGPEDNGDPGLTFDGATNPVCVRNKNERMRYDRIMVKESPSITLGNISLIGTEPMDDTNIKPSDHYGIHLLLYSNQARTASVP